ncbi:MAG: protein translocase subunit SecD [Actinobacteria bacterium]|nr:MAG: protein translocase subunit SecD [Actinomycetota bacterium]
MSDRRRHLTLLGFIAVALAGVALLAIPGSPVHKKATLGLDLQGGLEVVLKANPPKGHTLTADDLTRSIDIMRNRIDKLGVSEPEIRKQGSNQIVIQLAGVHDPAAAAKLIGKTAVLQFYDFENDLTGPSVTTGLQKVPVAMGSLFDLLNAPETRALADKGTPAQWYLFDANHRVIAGPTPTKELLPTLQQAEKKQKRTFKGPATVMRVPQNTIVVSCDPGSGNCLSTKQITSSKAFYLLKHRLPDAQGNGGIPEMTGTDLKLSGTRADIDSTTSQPVVLMQFTGHGKKVFHDITRREAQRGSLVCQGASSPQDIQRCAQHFAIVLDGQLQSVPYIDFKRNPDGIPGDTGAQIDMGGGSLGDAKKLALVLQTGALPVQFATAERTDVSATLGKDSLSQAKKAALVGLLVVALFLLLFYRFLGLVAVIGLGIYAAFLYAALLLFNVTLTLPGFAGLILTIGVAADANVVVFERIKEEVRSGKSVRAAISAGYSKGFHTILDANVVTAITALVLFAVATAQVKGFALMLLIGTVISLVTAVAATRAMLGLLAGFSWFNKPRFMGAQGQQTGKWLQIDFMGKRNLWFAISGVIILLGIGSLAVRGLNLGIDFKGGTQLSFKTPVAHTTGDVRSVMKAQGYADAVIQGRGASTNSAYKSFQIRTKALSGDKLTQVTTALEDKLQTTAPGATTVSSSFGRQIAKSAIIAVLFSLFLVVLYITIRFDLKFAVPVILAMLHDVLICIGIYALVGREVTSSTVAAILTVLGYSIYDTIIIFDRVRENIPLMRRSSFATITNVSLWETIRRSLATSFITLLPVIALYLFGGATLQDFAFALIVGIASGAYSSIFIAAPLLTIWKEREPEFARRKDVKVTKAGLEEAFEEAEEAAAAEPVQDLAPVATVDGGDGSAAAAAAKRERRRQRRRARPHGRAR